MVFFVIQEPMSIREQSLIFVLRHLPLIRSMQYPCLLLHHALPFHLAHIFVTNFILHWCLNHPLLPGKKIFSRELHDVDFGEPS